MTIGKILRSLRKQFLNLFLLALKRNSWYSPMLKIVKDVGNKDGWGLKSSHFAIGGSY